MTIDEKQEAIIREFEQLGDDWMQKYEYLIEMGKALPPMKEQHKTDQHLIKGCQSRSWLRTIEKEGKVYFEVESEAYIVKGIAALLVKILNGHTPEEIHGAQLYSIDRLGLRKHLSPMRSNGLFAIIREMKSCGHDGAAAQEETA